MMKRCKLAALFCFLLSLLIASPASGQQWHYEGIQTAELQQKYERNGLALPIILIGAGTITLMSGFVVLLYGVAQGVDSDLDGDLFYKPSSSGSGTRAAGGITMGVGAVLGFAGVTTLIIRSETRRGINKELRRRSTIQELSVGMTPTQGGSLLQLKARF